MNVNSRQAQILVALQVKPLDRIRLMKTLFLVWYRNGKPESGPFHFEPYLYGPCAFDLYATLEDMERHGLVIQAPHPINGWSPYYLTAKGQNVASNLDLDEKETIAEIARWAANQDFQTLLREVYKEAPEYANRSVFRPVPCKE